MSNPLNKEVSFRGMTLVIPASHNWVSLAEVRVPGGSRKVLAISYEEEPVVTERGNYIPKPGTDSRILLEVASPTNADHRNSLEFYGKKEDTVNENLLKNATLFSKDLASIITSDLAEEEKVHLIFCPECGALPKLLEACMPALEDVYGEEEDSEPTKEELLQFLSAIFGSKK